MLAKRLVQHMSASDDAEASMISKLKQACGFEYTSKLQRMFQVSQKITRAPYLTIYISNRLFFQDIGVSKDLNEQFRNHLLKSNEQLGVDFTIQVLSSGSWPFQQSFTFGLPLEVGSLSRKLLVSNKSFFFILVGTKCTEIHELLFRATLWQEIKLAL